MLSRVEKENYITEVSQSIGDCVSLIVVQYHGLNAGQIYKLRKACKDNGVSFLVVKNTLLRIVCRKRGFDEALLKLLSGPVAIAYSTDVIAPAKCIVGFAGGANNPLKIIGGFVDGDVVDVGTIKNIAAAQSIDCLRSSLLGLLYTPMRKFANVLDLYREKLNNNK